MNLEFGQTVDLENSWSRSLFVDCSVNIAIFYGIVATTKLGG